MSALFYTASIRTHKRQQFFKDLSLISVILLVLFFYLGGL